MYFGKGRYIIGSVSSDIGTGEIEGEWENLVPYLNNSLQKGGA